MRTLQAVGLVFVAVIAAGCGSSDEPKKKEKEEVMKVEDTAFGPLVGTPKKVQDRTDAAAEQYRDSMNERLDEDEGGKPKKDEPPGD
jgi:hypothetical protein